MSLLCLPHDILILIWRHTIQTYNGVSFQYSYKDIEIRSMLDSTLINLFLYNYILKLAGDDVFRSSVAPNEFAIRMVCDWDKDPLDILRRIPFRSVNRCRGAFPSGRKFLSVGFEVPDLALLCTCKNLSTFQLSTSLSC